MTLYFEYNTMNGETYVKFSTDPNDFAQYPFDEIEVTQDDLDQLEAHRQETEDFPTKEEFFKILGAELY